ncbi:TonB-dependent receptor [Stakelama saccharophila]|uniref:TonB-dependent receptor n=1 Tax=Stakelama saccharophila TaxID=3075605 RepID=A0ABZ0BCA8_9SPHN|nr:TonB-dependent receptor [Stakelama sp. W311]WNO54691.1 TonB-dependent receptor [Stakelama sp. W311]
MRSLSLPVLLSMLAAAPAARAEEAHGTVSVAAMRLDRAILVVGRQTGASIGLRDRDLARIRVHPVSGSLGAGQALDRMLAGTRARARRIGHGRFVIEARPAMPRPVREEPFPPPPPPEKPEDIIVTASKRDTPLSDYPGDAVVIDGDAFTLAAAGRGNDALETQSASLSSTHLGPGRNKLFLRGIADSSFTGPTQSTVGRYWGNMRVSYSAPDPDLRLYDINRVEILEGPQGTLYGAGSLGGIIRVVPQHPQLDRIGGRAWIGGQATEHGDPGGDLGALINLPLASDVAAARVLAYAGREGGYIDDRLRRRDDVNQVDIAGGRAMLRVAPASDWTIDLAATYQRIDGDDAQYADRDRGDLSRESAIAQPYANDYFLGGLTVRGRIGEVSIVSTTGITDQYVAETFDATANANGELDFAVAHSAPRAFRQINRIRMVATETRLWTRAEDGSGWLLGVSGLTNETRINRKMGPVVMIAPATGVRNRVDEVTAFGEATLVPASDLELTLGGRLTWSRLSGSAEDAPVAYAFRKDPQGKASRESTEALPSLALAWRPSGRWTVFARVQEGYRPGGLAVESDAIRRFQGDRIVTAEIGGRWNGGAAVPLDLSVTLAATRWHDIQADLIDGTGFPTTTNIGDGRVHSLGIRAAWRPLYGLTLDGSLYLNDSRVTSTPPGVAHILAAAASEEAPNALPNVADVSARIGGRYRVDLGGADDLTLSGYARYVGESRLGVGRELGQRQGDYLDSGLDLRLGTAARGITLGVTNLFDVRGNRFALGSPFQVREGGQITPLRPRTIRIGFDASW